MDYRGACSLLGRLSRQKAKKRAAHEDSDQIRDELARTTQAVKKIEAKVNSDLWDRQWRLNQKRDAYANLLTALNDVAGLNEEQRVLLNGPPVVQTPEAKYVELNDSIMPRLNAIRRANTLMKVFASEACVAIMDAFWKYKMSGDTRLELVITTLNSLKNVEQKLIVEVRRDLYGPEPSKDFLSAANRG